MSVVPIPILVKVCNNAERFYLVAHLYKLYILYTDEEIRIGCFIFLVDSLAVRLPNRLVMTFILDHLCLLIVIQWEDVSEISFSFFFPLANVM